MDNLFKALPRDLQGEILTEFVGTHVVRNGKLMRKITSGVLCLKKQRPLYLPLGTWIAYKGICYNTNVVLRRDYKMDIYLWENWSTRDITYVYYRYNYNSNSYRYELKNGQSLPRFIKHDYPSYPYTDKKLGRASKKMTLY